MICQRVVAGDFLLAKYSHRALTAGKWYEVSRVDNSYPSRVPRYHLKEISGSAQWHPFWFGLTDTVGSEEIAGAEAHVRHADSPAGSLADNQQPAEDPDEWVLITDRNHTLRSCDQFLNSNGNWWPVISVGKTVRKFKAENNDAKVRCLRRDLPKVEEPTQPNLYTRDDDSQNPMLASSDVLIAEAIDILSPSGPNAHSNAVRMLALHRDLLMSENEALKAKIRLAECQYLGAGGNAKPDEIVQAMRDVLNGTYSSGSLLRKA